MPTAKKDQPSRWSFFILKGAMVRTERSELTTNGSNPVMPTAKKDQPSRWSFFILKGAMVRTERSKFTTNGSNPVMPTAKKITPGPVFSSQGKLH
jgi:hypothetical protein